MTTGIGKKRAIAAMALMLSMGLMMGRQAQEVYAAQTESQASSNAYLKSLNVEPGAISPEFSSEVTDYTISVDADVDRVSVTCSTAEANATVIEAGGFKDLQEGSNDAIITVQAADGTECSYHLTIIRGTASSQEETEEEAETEESSTETTDTESADTESAAEDDDTDSDEVTTEVGAVPTSTATGSLTVGGDSIFSTFQVNSTFPQELLPDGFVEEDYDYKGITVQSAYFSAGDIRLLYLSAGDGTSTDFRIYYEDTDTFMDFLQLKGTDGKFIMPVRYQAQIKIPDNYTSSYLPLEDKVISSYIYTELTDNPVTVSNGEEQDETTETTETEETEPVNVEDLDEEVEFYLLYAMNNEGSENFYLYDIVEDTYQRYVERDTSYELDQSYFKYKDIAHQRFAIMCVLIVVLVIAVFCIINLIIRNRELKADLAKEDSEAEETPKKPKKKQPEQSGKSEQNPKAAKPKKSKQNPEATQPEKAEQNPEAAQSGKSEQSPKAEQPEKPEQNPKTKQPEKAEQNPKAEQSEKPEQNPKTKQSEKPEQNPKTKQPEKAEQNLKAEQSKQPEQNPKAKQSEQSKTRPAAELEPDLMSLEEKIIGQLRATQEKETEASKTNPGFKMINLSREPEPTGLDDDFEFEFINLEDN